MGLLQVQFNMLQKILEPLLVLMVEEFVRTQFGNHYLLQQEHMELEPSILVLLNHQLLILVVGLSINNNKLLVEEGSNNPAGVINQSQFLRKVIHTVNTKNVPVSKSKRKQDDHIQPNTGVRNAVLIRVRMMYGFVIQSRPYMESKLKLNVI